MNDPYKVPVEDVLKSLNVEAKQGLSKAEARLRIDQFGRNELQDKGRKKAWQILLDQVREVMVLILLGAVVLSLGMREFLDAAVIFVIVILNTFLGFWQEWKAENAMAALKKLSSPMVRVRRDASEQQLSSAELVPGDIIFLEAGNLVPADCRLLEAVNLKVQEAALTGESEPVEKHSSALPDGDIPLADRKNMTYMGTIVTTGRGLAIVTSTGMKTELGNIAGMLQSVQEEQTPLQRRLGKLGNTLALMALGLIVLVSIVMLLQGTGWKQTLMSAISLAVAAIPEGLPAVVTIVLALGAQQMLRKKALIRQLPAVETLGSVTVICSDKTGTLTQNKMSVREAILPDKTVSFSGNEDISEAQPSLDLLLLSGLLCNDAVLDEKTPDGILGDPTEGALVLAAKKAALQQRELQQILPRIRELPFDSERKRMSTVHQLPDPATLPERVRLALESTGPIAPGTLQIFCKGAVDGLVEVCNRILLHGSVTSLTKSLKEKILEENRVLAGKGVRVLGLVSSSLTAENLDRPGEYEHDLIYLGLVSLLDPVRPEAIEAIRTCQRAGIRPVMITGDHPLTATAIAKELGIEHGETCLSGAELEAMSESELAARVSEVSVYARVSPKHKMVIIDALQKQKQIVAMTGDGVNDAPALKSADIGVAMGITGTDVSKESADMILLDDNFATIVTAVHEGRRLYDNIRKFVKYILTGNTGEIAVMLLGPLLGLPLPLLPIQILWINLVTDGLPAIALGYEEAEPDLMERKPIHPDEGIFAHGLGFQILLMGTIIGILSVVTGRLFRDSGMTANSWQSMVFTTLTFCQMAYVLCVRKQKSAFFHHFFKGNPLLPLAVAGALLLQLLLLYVPWLNTIFKTVPLSAAELGFCTAAAMLIIVITELKKKWSG